MIKRLRKFSGSEFGKNVLTLVTGTAAGQLISIIAAPALTRIYLPHDYGILGTFMAITGTVIIIATLQYSLTVIMPEEREDGLALLHLSIGLISVFSALTFLIVLVLKGPLLKLIRAEELEYWIYLAPISVFFGGLISPLTVWANRVKAYKTMSVSRVLPQVFTVIVSVTLGLLIKGPLGLIISYILGQAINSIYLVFTLVKNEPDLLRRQPLSRIRAQMTRYKSFPFYTLPAEFINVFTSNLPVFLLSRFAGPAAVGAYNLSNRLLGMPSTIVSGSIGEVFKQRATEDYNQKGNCRHIFNKTAKHLSLFSFLPFLVVALFGDKLFVFVFGKPWLMAGEFSQILSVMFMARFIVSPLAYVYYIYGRLREDFIIHVWILLSCFVCFYLGFQVFDSVHWALALFSINYVFIYILYYFRSYTFSKSVK